MSWKILFLEEGHPAFDRLTPEQKQFLVPPSGDDFFVSMGMFSGLLGEKHGQISCKDKDGHKYFSLNEMIASIACGSFSERDQRIAENLREYLRGSYEELKV